MRRSAASLTLAVLALLAPAGPAAAQPLDEALREKVESLYRVDPIPGGIELRPRESRFGVETITLAGERARINGVQVRDDVLGAWLGADAADVRRLLALSPLERRRLFGFSLEDLERTPSRGPVVVEAPERGDRREDESPAIPAPPEPPEPPAPPAEPATPAVPWSEDRHRIGEKFSLFDDVEVGPEESAREAVAVMGSVRVLGEVRGDVSAVMGSVWVEGRVGGEVVAVNGSVHLGPKAEVLKGVTAVGGTVERAAGSEVRGAVTEVPYWGGARWGQPWPDRGPRWRGGWWFHPPDSPWLLFWKLIKLGGLALLLCITVLLAPRAVERARAVAAAEWLKAFLVGLLAEILFFPALGLVIAILVVTVVGCLVVIPLLVVLPFFVLGVLLLAYAVVAACTGRWLAGRLAWRSTSSFVHVLAGMVVLEALAFAGHVLPMAGGWAWFPGFFLGGLGDVVRFVAVTLGLGAILLARSRRGEAREAPPPPAREPEPEPWAAGPLAPIAVPPIEPAAGSGERPG